VALGFAGVGLALVASTAATCAYAFGAGILADYRFVVVLLGLIPHAVAAVAIGTAGPGTRGRAIVVLGGLTVLVAAAQLFWMAGSEARARWEAGRPRDSSWFVTQTGTDWLVVQGVAALVAAFASGLTWERRPRYGLWVLFTLAFLAFALLVDFCERLHGGVVSDWLRVVRRLVRDWSRWDRYIARQELIGLARVLLPAVCLGWLAQCAAPRLRRRVPDQAADYGDPPQRPSGR
jgi:hypothetical protein